MGSYGVGIGKQDQKQSGGTTENTGKNLEIGGGRDDQGDRGEVFGTTMSTTQARHVRP